MAQVLRTFQDSKVHYHQLRQLTYEDTIAHFRGVPMIIGEITQRQASEADSWNQRMQSELRTVPWSWQIMHQHFNKYHKRFDMSVAVNGTLCALCYGQPSQGKWLLKIHVLQGDLNADRNALRGQSLEIITYAANTYATLLGSKEVWICNPLNDRLTALYESKGFTRQVDANGQVTHLIKKT